jgi:hypothetical protein
MRIVPIAAAALAVSLIGGTVIAQAAPVRTRGTIAAVTASEIDVTTRTGKMSYKITDATHVVGAKTATLGDIQKGSYIGSAAVPAGGGKLRALEVTVFPASMKGAGEGHYPWDRGPSSSMTNGTVGSLISSQGSTMTVTYKGGQKIIEVPSDVPVVSVEPSDKSALQAGQKVIVFVAPDGGTAGAIVYGENGITPPQ